VFHDEEACKRYEELEEAKARKEKEQAEAHERRRARDELHARARARVRAGAKTLKGKRREVELTQHDKKKVTAKATVYGALCICKTSDLDRWAVSHVATGLAIALGMETMGMAREAAWLLLNLGMDWDVENPADTFTGAAWVAVRDAIWWYQCKREGREPPAFLLAE